MKINPGVAIMACGVVTIAPVLSAASEPGAVVQGALSGMMLGAGIVMYCVDKLGVMDKIRELRGKDP